MGTSRPPGTNTSEISLLYAHENLYLDVVAVAGVVLRFARTHPIVGVAQASTGTILGFLRASYGLHDADAGRCSRRGMGQLPNTGDEQRQVAEVLEELDGPGVPGGGAGLLTAGRGVFDTARVARTFNAFRKGKSWGKGSGSRVCKERKISFCISFNAGRDDVKGGCPLTSVSAEENWTLTGVS